MLSGHCHLKLKRSKPLNGEKIIVRKTLTRALPIVFFVGFLSEKDREVYLPHPEHKAFVAVLSPHLDKVLVIDYWAEK